MVLTKTVCETASQPTSFQPKPKPLPPTSGLRLPSTTFPSRVRPLFPFYPDAPPACPHRWAYPPGCYCSSLPFGLTRHLPCALNRLFTFSARLLGRCSGEVNATASRGFERP